MSTSRKILYGSLTVIGFSFWFILAFPFPHHNESYIWLAQLPKMSFMDALFGQMQPVSSFRPLGQGTAWMYERLFGFSLYPSQIVNYVLAVVGWLIIFKTIKEKRVFSLSALLVGGFFFSGYIYLFHFHGLCYCLLPILVALLYGTHYGKWSRGRPIWLFLLATAVFFFHPFALVLYIAAATGVMIERRKEITGTRRIELIALIIAAAVINIIVVIKTGTASHMNGFYPIVSYKMTEINHILSAIAISLGLATIAGMNMTKGGKAIFAVGAIILAAAFYKLGIPLILVWGLTCLIKTFMARTWSIAFLLMTAFLLPAAAGSGSPTHTLIFLMLCTAILPMGWSSLENRLSNINSRYPAALLLLMGIMIVVLRFGVNVPIVSKLANPLLAEKEKSTQLEQIASWILSTKYRNYRVEFAETAGNPSKSDNAIDRRYRPPAREEHFAAYLDYKRGPADKARKIIVTFGSELVPGAKEIHRIKGHYAGDTIAYLPSR